MRKLRGLAKLALRQKDAAFMVAGVFGLVIQLVDQKFVSEQRVSQSTLGEPIHDTSCLGGRVQKPLMLGNLLQKTSSVPLPLPLLLLLLLLLPSLILLPLPLLVLVLLEKDNRR